MRFLFIASFPVEAGNASAKKDGFRSIQKILEEQKPEAVYFTTVNGLRTCWMIVHMNDASEMAVLGEPWFLALNAAVEWKPVMVPADLAQAGPAVEQAVKTYG
jgi:hypothetical protein